MKKLLLSVFVSLLLTGGLCAQTSIVRSAVPSSKAPVTKTIEVGDKEYLMGYVSDEISENGVGLGQTCTLSGAVLFSKDLTERFKGCTVKKILVGFANNKPTNASAWIKSSLDDTTPLASQSISTVKAGWNIVELGTPYVLTGEPVYFGFTIKQTANTYPLSLTGEQMENGALLNFGQGWQDVAGLGRLSILAVIEGDKVPQNDIIVNSLNVNDLFHGANDPYTFTASVSNNGKKAVTSYEVTYQVGTSAPVTETVNTNLAYRATEEYSKTVSLEGMGGHNDVKFTVNKVNGEADEYIADNSALDSIVVYSESFPRKTLLEHFTTEKCPNCPYGDKVLEKCMEDRDNVIWVAHHVGYYTDKYTITASNDYLTFYGPEGTFAPAAMLDRTNFPSEGDYPVFNIGYSDANVGAQRVGAFMDRTVAMPAFISVNIRGEYDPATSKLTVYVTGEKKSELSYVSDKPLITVFLTEDQLPGTQSGAGDVLHDHVLRSVMTKTSGDEPTWDGNNYSYSVSTELKSAWKFEDMKIVAFASNWNTKNMNDCKVLNVNAIKLYDVPGNIESVGNDIDLKVSVENGSIKVDGEYSRLNVYTVSGTEVDNHNLVSGLYIVKVSKDNNTQLSKVVVK